MGAFTHIQPGTRVLRVAEGSGSPSEWSAALRAFQPDAATLLKSDGGAFVWRAAVLSHDCVVKLWEPRGVWARLKLLFGGSRARRHWRGADRLVSIGVSSARPLALAREFGNGPPREWLVLEFVPGRTLIDTLDRPELSVRAQHTLAAAVGLQVGAIVRAGLYNRDHKPSNLIVSFDGSRPTITVLDTVAIRRCPPASLRRAAQMLASLHLEPSGLGCPARAGLRARCVREVAAAVASRDGSRPPRPAVRAAARLLWEEAAHMVAAHGDPRPKIDPRTA